MTVSRNLKIIISLSIWIVAVVSVQRGLAWSAVKETKNRLNTVNKVIGQPVNNIIPEIADNYINDDDKDGLTNDLERVYGTDPKNPDTDSDGYPDGLEIKNHYNPLGPGRLATFKIAVQDEIKPVQQELASNMLFIPSLNIKVPINFPESANEKAYQQALLNGVALHPNTAKIGELGNPFIFGHSSDYSWSKGKYKTIFVKLSNIKDGTDIFASNSGGQVYNYRVVNQFIAESTDIHLLDQYGYSKKLLTLQTSYPVGTAKQRYIVIAEMVE
ncbi:sortase [Patescibacteria group bacterium]|nr:sortase [Patescibacteria group bacterium]